MPSRSGKRASFSNDNKTATLLERWARYDEDRWSARNTRFKEDQDLWALVKPEGLNADVAQDLTILNDPRVLVRKASALIARHPNVIEVPPAPGVAPEIAQRIENFLYAWDQSINHTWMGGLHAPYRYDQAFYQLLRGWLCERTMLVPEGEDELRVDAGALWDHQVFDPANLYPHTSGNAISRVSHIYTVSAGELKQDPFYSEYARKSLNVGQADEVDDGTTIQVRSIYWRDGSDDSGGNGRNPSWWHAVLGSAFSPVSVQFTQHGGNSEVTWIKEPVELGYNPWTIVIGKGAAFRNTPWDDSEDYLKEVGTGILDEGRDAYAQINRMATKLATLLTLETNPPVTAYMRNNQPTQLTMRPGGRNYLLEKDKLEFHRIGPNSGDYKLHWEILMQRVDRAGLPAAFFGSGVDQGPAAAATMMAAGRDILWPFVEAINRADEFKYRRVLEQYRDFGPSKPLPAKMPPDGMGRVLSATISAADIKEQGVYVTIDREDMTPQELAQKINLGIAALREKGISLKTFRRDWMKVRNPDAENLQILAEQVYLNEDVIKQLTPIALQATGADKLRQIWEMVQNPLPPQEQQGGLPPGVQPGMPQPQPGMPGMPAPGQPVGPPVSGPQPGLPATALPAIQATGNPLVNVPPAALNPQAAQFNQLMAMLQGGAQGGAGQGGLPPVPGQGQPVPPLPIMGSGRPMVF